jgi:transposase InsO family protein
MPWETKNQMNQRSEFVLKAMKTDNFRELCREYKISPKVGYKWKARFEQEGLAGMGEKSRRPKSIPGGLSEEEVCRIVLLKERHRHWGARKLVVLYERQWGKGPSESSIKRVLKKAGLVDERKRRPAKEGGRICSGRKASAPNDVWTVDFKGWWHDAAGRCEPLTVRDEYSRMVLENRALANAKTETVKAVFEQLFEKYGLPAAIRSDNGAPFASVQALLGLSRLSVWWLALGIELERSRPACPQDNGAHERMHKDVAREIEGTEYEGRQATLDEWTREFNQVRPHESLGMQTPVEVYKKSARKWKGTPDELEYKGMQKRRVHQHGTIHYGNRKYFISSALAGWDVGLKANGADKMDVYFGRLLLGQIEEQSASFAGIKPRKESDEPEASEQPPRATEFGACCTPGPVAPADACAPVPCVAPAPNSGAPSSSENTPIDTPKPTMKQ